MKLYAIESIVLDWLNEPTPPAGCKEKEECPGDCCDGSWASIKKRGLREGAPEEAKRGFEKYLRDMGEARKVGKLV